MGADENTRKLHEVRDPGPLFTVKSVAIRSNGTAVPYGLVGIAVTTKLHGNSQLTRQLQPRWDRWGGVDNWQAWLRLSRSVADSIQRRPSIQPRAHNPANLAARPCSKSVRIEGPFSLSGYEPRPLL